jgi:hypothetical protein
MKINHAQIVVLAGSMLAVLAFLLFPQWVQVYKTDLRYDKMFQHRLQGGLGRAMLFWPPKSVPESRFGGPQIPAEDFVVLADWEGAAIQCFAIAFVSLGLLITFRVGSIDSPGAKVFYLTRNRRLISAAFLSLLLPVPGTPGKPVLYDILAGFYAQITGNIGDVGLIPFLFLWACFIAFYSFGFFLLLSLLNLALKSRV